MVVQILVPLKTIVTEKSQVLVSLVITNLHLTQDHNYLTFGIYRF